MHLSNSALVLATLAIGQAAAATMGVGHAHGVKYNHATRHAEMMKAQNLKREISKRDTADLSAADASKLTTLGLGSLGLNPSSANTHAWIGGDGPYTNEFINQSGEDVILCIWGVAGSWVNAVQPQITVSIPAGSSKTISFPDSSTGAWAPVYSDTKLVNGQISETWGEFTFGQWGVVDVSREVNMKGRSMSIVGPQCTTDMDTCVFVCPDGQDVCTFGYQLLNCGAGSQPGANYGTYDGSPSGGCGGMGSSAALKTYLG